MKGNRAYYWQPRPRGGSESSVSITADKLYLSFAICHFFSEKIKNTVRLNVVLTEIIDVGTAHCQHGTHNRNTTEKATKTNFYFPCLNQFFTKRPFHNQKPDKTSKGNTIYLTIIALTGMVATGPYINPVMGMLKTICIHLMIFLSVEAFMINFF
jgi:hypothetical protein